jgi:hypothetical protein
MDLGVFQHRLDHASWVSMLPRTHCHCTRFLTLTLTHSLSLTHHSPHSPGFVRSLGFRPIRAHLVGRFRCMLTTDASPGPLPRPARTKCRTHTLDFVSSLILLLQRDASDGAPPPVLLLVAVCTTLLRPMGRIASPLRPKMDRVWPRRARRLTQEDEALIREVGGLDDGGDLGSVPVGK